MKSYDIFKVYIWLVQTIYRARRITLEEINEKWCETDMSGGVEFSRTTFVRHKNSIEEIFGIYIECDRKNGYEYYIGNRSVLEGDSVLGMDAEYAFCLKHSYRKHVVARSNPDRTDTTRPLPEYVDRCHETIQEGRNYLP